MRLLSPRRSYRRSGAALGVLLVLTAAVAALVAGCGTSASTATTTSGGRSVQVLATVRRGDLVQTASGRVQLKSTTSKANVKVAVQVAGQGAAQVAAGQSVSLTFIKLPAGAGRFFGSGSPRPSAAPSAGAGQGYSGGQGYGNGGYGGGQGFFGQSGQGGQRAFRGKTAQGTVTAVSAGSNGAVTATVTIAKLPAGVTTAYMGIALIQVKVLASNVLIIPTAAIKGSGSSATVQLLQNGKTATQSVVVGQTAQGEAEITSGLSVGQSVVYTRTFTGRFPGSRSGPFNGQGGGYFQNGGQGGVKQSSGTTNGV
ncbi:MAG TPA: efflux RND transporter periplasmic adaptor subunit [Thermoleophilia bacterium]|nr:efflux RND transporter periplasmic adaptor subunit [Thermoleophilia bacterium]